MHVKNLLISYNLSKLLIILNAHFTVICSVTCDLAQVVQRAKTVSRRYNALVYY